MARRNKTASLQRNRWLYAIIAILVIISMLATFIIALRGLSRRTDPGPDVIRAVQPISQPTP